MIDTSILTAIGTVIGSAIASFWGGRKGSKHIAQLVRTVRGLSRRMRRVEDKLGILRPQGNGKAVAVMELGRVEPIDVVQSEKERRRIK